MAICTIMKENTKYYYYSKELNQFFEFYKNSKESEKFKNSKYFSTTKHEAILISYLRDYLNLSEEIEKNKCKIDVLSEKVKNLEKLKEKCLEKLKDNPELLI